jgi:hypothetical protein
MRVTTVKHSKTKLACSKCGDDIRPSRNEKQTVLVRGKKTKKTVRVLGDSYRWIKFNRRPKRVVCMKPSCAFRRSDMTSSDKLSQLYAAVETAEDTISSWDGEDVSTLESAMEDLANEVREVAEGYGESADNMEQAFTSGSSLIDEIREKQESLNSWADALEALDFTAWDVDEETESNCEHDGCGKPIHCHNGPWTHDDDALDADHDAEHAEPENSDGQTKGDWAEEQRTTASDAIEECPL